MGGEPPAACLTAGGAGEIRDIQVGAGGGPWGDCRRERGVGGQVRGIGRAAGWANIRPQVEAQEALLR
ncbi:hypothetical protein [Kamptonema formosum]|uniref:hypothetical protein n=1 Tax=Kamptonema formosum TaxID=331992 RepID=UPI00037F6EDE|nr:hypothetical protein [Oscillatoria sp. PCC 10802]